MAIDIGPKIGIDGEAEFRKSLQNINQQLKTLGSEMKAVTSAFTDETSAQEKSRQSSALLREEISKQREKIELLKKGLDDISECADRIYDFTHENAVSKDINDNAAKIKALCEYLNRM